MAGLLILGAVAVRLAMAWRRDQLGRGGGLPRQGSEEVGAIGTLPSKGSEEVAGIGTLPN